MIAKRIILDILGFLLIFFAPWYIFVPYILLMVFLGEWYGEAIILALISDFVFNPAPHFMHLFPFFVTTLVLATSLIWFILKRQFIFSR